MFAILLRLAITQMYTNIPDLHQHYSIANLTLIIKAV